MNLDPMREYLNPLHVCCRLLRLHISRRLATKICRWYEFNLYRHSPLWNGPGR